MGNAGRFYLGFQDWDMTFTCTTHNQDTGAHINALIYKKGGDTVLSATIFRRTANQMAASGVSLSQVFQLDFLQISELDEMAVWLHDINQGEGRTEGMLSFRL